jgi:hypothetical protein
MEGMGFLMAAMSGNDSANAAREALDHRVGHTLTDTEWARVSARLIGFVSIVRIWEQEEAGTQDAIPRQPFAA